MPKSLSINFSRGASAKLPHYCLTRETFSCRFPILIIFRPSAPLKQTARSLEATINGVTMPFATGDGVFSKSALDEGSRVLLETALRHSSWPANARVADLGCGWGAISCFVAALAPQTLVFGCDINERAVALAHQNAKLNNLENAFFWCGDGLNAAKSDFFDVIFCNPPVRAGNETIAQLFEGAQRCLKPGRRVMGRVAHRARREIVAKAPERAIRHLRNDGN